MSKKMLWNFIPILIGIMVVLLVIWIKTSEIFEEGERTRVTSSTLRDAIDIGELSTAEFTYNGIATVYKDKEQKNIKCHIRYFSKVKAYVEVNNIKYIIDDVNMTIQPILPDIQYNVLVADTKALSYMPDDVQMELKDALAACEQDAINEATKSEQLKESAIDNLKNTVEALIYPIASYNGYTIIWE